MKDNIMEKVQFNIQSTVILHCYAHWKQQHF